ncbi:TetR/AcrR family transcriptional regulator [Pseudonocardia pini]|uniref:TetR/AcrR family transcriptional regulator n=1 Tax=Pseudonocardia pini TaxID=2758030 RepID=UPI0015F05229|nr:TetR/AcrR family transcriptional regulator [Pseudonocardia pini]
MAQQVRSQRATLRRTQLLAASARLFQEFGYHNVSMDDVATAVGITGPALYRHFRNKHDVLAQALLDQLAAVEVAVRAAADAPPDERWERFGQELCTVVMNREEALLWKRERRHLTGDEQLEFRARLREALALTVRVVRAVRPELADQEADMVGWGVLSVYSNTRDYRHALDRAAMPALLERMASAIVACDVAAVPVPAGDRRTPEERVPAGRRERILHAAAVLFDRHGYYAVSIEDIAAAADAAIATVYQHFTGKTELLQAVLVRGAEGAPYVAAHRLAYTRTPAEAVDTLVGTFVELALGPHRRLLGILAADVLYLPAEGQRAIRKTEREFVEEWVAALCALRPELSAAEARGLAQSAMGLVTDLAQTPGLRARPGIAAELRLLATAVVRS